MSMVAAAANVLRRLPMAAVSLIVLCTRRRLVRVVFIIVIAAAASRFRVRVAVGPLFRQIPRLVIVSFFRFRVSLCLLDELQHQTPVDYLRHPQPVEDAHCPLTHGSVADDEGEIVTNHFGGGVDVLGVAGAVQDVVELLQLISVVLENDIQMFDWGRVSTQRLV